MALKCYNLRPMRNDRFIRHAAVLVLVAIAVAYLFFRFPRSPQDTTTLLDFSEFYAAGEIVRHGLGSSLYDLKVQAEFQLQVAPVHAFYLRPPFETLLFVPLTYLGYRGAYIAWTLVSLALLFGAVILIRRNTEVLYAMQQYTRGIPVDLGLLFLISLTFEPTMDSFLIGQDAVLVLFIYTLVFIALKRKREPAAGVLLACGLFKFHLVLPFALVLLFRRRWRFLLWFAAAACVLVTVSVGVSGPRVLTAYPGMFLEPSYRKLMGFQPEYAANLRGLLHLLGGNRMPTASAAVVAVLSFVMLWWTARLWNRSRLEIGFSAAVIATLLTGFHSFVYDLCLLLLPVAILCGELALRRALLNNWRLNVVLILLFIPSVHHLLISYHVYALMAVLLLAFLVIVSILATRPSREAGLRYNVPSTVMP